MPETAPSYPPLPEGLPTRWRVRAPRPDDAVAVTALVAACDTAVLGHPDIALADIEVELSRGPERQVVVIDDERVWVWAYLYDKAAGRTIADVYVDPSLDRQVGDRLAAWCWRIQLAQAAQVAAARGVVATTLDVGVLGGDASTESRLRAAGFAPRRTFWRMERPLTDADRPAVPTPGVTIRRVEEPDRPTVYAVVEAAFEDHWNHHRRSYAEWLEQVAGSPGADPALWWLAEVDGAVVGALVATRQMADDDAIYVAVLATLRAARRRGVGTALLREAFAAGRAQGWSLARLNVDAESTTSAPSLYAGVGLVVSFSAQAWMREVTVAAT